jgi:RNA polymerase sigma-70 factor (ECF subfamily)
MEDYEIVDLYWSRNQLAITQTADKYGRFLQNIAMNILSDTCDGEECVNDTYHKAWTTIPPVRPQSLMAYLGKIVRNISISLYRVRHAGKRDTRLSVAISELEECIPASKDVESQIELQLLTEALNRWLHSLGEEDMSLFVRRYWNGDSIDTIAKQWNVRANKLSVRLCRLRKDLKIFLEKEGIAV